MTYGIGANDVANSVGTAIGSKIITPVQALILAGIAEFAGAALLGGEVAATLRSRLVNNEDWEEEVRALLLAVLLRRALSPRIVLVFLHSCCAPYLSWDDSRVRLCVWLWAALSCYAHLSLLDLGRPAHGWLHVCSARLCALAARRLPQGLARVHHPLHRRLRVRFLHRREGT